MPLSSRPDGAFSCVGADRILIQLRLQTENFVFCFPFFAQIARFVMNLNEASRFLSAIICVPRDMSMTSGDRASMVEILLCVFVQSRTYI